MKKLLALITLSAAGAALAGDEFAGFVAANLGPEYKEATSFQDLQANLPSPPVAAPNFPNGIKVETDGEVTTLDQFLAANANSQLNIGTRNPDGSYSYSFQGTTNTVNRDGSVTKVEADGRTSVISNNGQVVNYDANGKETSREDLNQYIQQENDRFRAELNRRNQQPVSVQSTAVELGNGVELPAAPQVKITVPKNDKSF